MRLRPRPWAFGRGRRPRAFGSKGWPRFARARTARFGAGWPGWLRDAADARRRRALAGGPPTAWTRSVPGLLAVVTAVVLAGLVFRAGGGTHHGQGASPEAGGQRVLAAGAVRVPVPPGWSRSDRMPQLPDVPIAEPVVLDNVGSGVQAVVGLVPATSPTLLPAGFVGGLRADLPKPRKVRIGDRLRGYHYVGLAHPGVTRLLDMYVAPTTLGTLTVACLAETVESLLDGCLDVVSGLTVAGPGRPIPADGPAAFREALATQLTALDGVSGRVRRALKSATTTDEQAGALAPLPAAYRTAADSVASLAPPSPTWPQLIVEQLRGTGEAYDVYARSLTGGDLAPYLEARARLAQRRAGLRRLLDRYSAVPIAKGNP